jgi:hypothetical protein
VLAGRTLFLAFGGGIAGKIQSKGGCNGDGAHAGQQAENATSGAGVQKTGQGIEVLGVH